MKLPYKEILTIQQGLTEALGLKGPGLGKVVYAVAKNARLIHGELEDFQTAQNELVKAYGARVDGDKFKIIPEKAEEFDKEMKNLLNTEVEIPLHKLQWTDLQERVSGSCAADLDKIIEFPPDGP